MVNVDNNQQDDHDENDDEDDDDDHTIHTTSSFTEDSQPWKTIFANSARARWRSSMSSSNDAQHQAIQAIIRDTVHPKPRLKRSTQQLAELAKGYRRLSDKRHRERAKLSNQRYVKPGDAQQDKRATALPYGPHELLTHLRLRSPANFEIAQRVLKECRHLLRKRQSFRPRRILDFGIGCGSASAAALQVFGDDADIEWIHGIDASHTMRQGAERYLQEFIQHTNEQQQLRRQQQQEQQQQEQQQEQSLSSESSSEPDSESDSNTDHNHHPRTLAPRITLSGHLSADPTLTADQLTGTMTRAAFDLCLCSFTAAEIPKHSAILTAAALLWEKLRPGGILVVIEPGTPDGFANVRSIRSMLLDCCPPEGQDEGDEECHVVAPCTHSSHCPLGLYGPHLRTAQSLQETVETTVTTPSDTIDTDTETDRTLATRRGPGDEESMEGDFIDVTANETIKDDDGMEQSQNNDVVEVDDDDDVDFDDNFIMDADDDKLPPGFVEVPFDYDAGAEDQETQPEVATTKGYCSFSHTFSSRKGEKISYLVVQKRITGDDHDKKLESREGDNIKSVLNGLDLSEWLSKHIVDDDDEDANEDAIESEPKEENPINNNESSLEEEEEVLTVAKRLEESISEEERRSNMVGLELVREQPESFGRVIRAPRKHRNHILIVACTDKGLVRHTVTKALSKKAPGIYQAARKARWGGFWPNSGNKEGRPEPMHAEFGERD